MLPAAAARAAEPPGFTVDFSFTSVGGKRPPNIVEIRRAGRGKLSFADEPLHEEWINAESVTGTVAYEVDVLTPEPRTEQIRLKVVKGRYRQLEASASDKVVGESAELGVEVVSSTLKTCEGAKGTLSISYDSEEKSRGVRVSLRCGGAPIVEGQTAGSSRNSRIHITFSASCVRGPSSAARQATCRSADPVVGTWTWKFAPPGEKIAAHGSVTFSSDGTMSWSGGASGTWKRTGSSLTLTWKKSETDIDTMTLAGDGRTMTGSNNSGWSVQGVKT